MRKGFLVGTLLALLVLALPLPGAASAAPVASVLAGQTLSGNAIP